MLKVERGVMRVADAQGHSLFSRTLKEHNERVQAYRLAEKAAHPQ